MRILEIAFIVGAMLLCHFALGLSGIAALACAAGAVLVLNHFAKLRHRQAFRKSLKPGLVIRSFKVPSSVFGSPMPYSWLRVRHWYSSVAVAADRSEHEYEVMVEGTFFGLFWISVERQIIEGTA